MKSLFFRIANGLTDSKNKSVFSACIRLLHALLEQYGEMVFFSLQYVSFTPVELIAETSGVPFSITSQFSSSVYCLLVAFHATAISAHPRVIAWGSWDWDHFELLIFILHKGAGRAGLPVVNTDEWSDCHCACVNSRSQAVLSHINTLSLVCMDDLPDLNTDCNKCQSKTIFAHCNILQMFQLELQLPSVHKTPFPVRCYCTDPDIVTDFQLCNNFTVTTAGRVDSIHQEVL